MCHYYCHCLSAHCQPILENQKKKKKEWKEQDDRKSNEGKTEEEAGGRKQKAIKAKYYYILTKPHSEIKFSEKMFCFGHYFGLVEFVMKIVCPFAV